MGHWPIYIRLTATALMWGGTFIAGRAVAGSLAATNAAIGRFTVAAAFLILLTFLREGRLQRPDMGQVMGTLFLGFFGIFAYNIFFFNALSLMPASRTALFVAFNPICSALMLALFFRERFPLLKWTGIAVALFGALFVVGNGDLTAVAETLFASQSGELLILGAVVSWAIYTVFGQRLVTGLSVYATTTYSVIWGLLLITVWHIMTQSGPIFAATTLTDGAAILYLGLFGTVVPFVWYNTGVRTLGAARTAIFTNLVPVFGVVLGVVFLGESLPSAVILGGSIVLVGIILTNSASAGARRWLR